MKGMLDLGNTVLLPDSFFFSLFPLEKWRVNTLGTELDFTQSKNHQVRSQLLQEQVWSRQETQFFSSLNYYVCSLWKKIQEQYLGKKLKQNPKDSSLRKEFNDTPLMWKQRNSSISKTTQIRHWGILPGEISWTAESVSLGVIKCDMWHSSSRGHPCLERIWFPENVTYINPNNSGVS